MRTILIFLIGVAVGAIAFWYLTDTASGGALLEKARDAARERFGNKAVDDAEAALDVLGDETEDTLAGAIDALGSFDYAAAVEAARGRARDALAALPDTDELADTVTGWESEMAAVEEAVDTGAPETTEVAEAFEPETVAVRGWGGFQAHPDFRKCPVIQVSNSGPVDADLNLLDYTPWMTTPAGPLIRAPVGAACLSSGYGPRTVNGQARNHAGVDYYNREGGAIYAAGPGRVIHAGMDDAYGESVRIDHGDGVIGLYAHMVPGSLRVHEGDEVRQGDVIGSMGQSGRAFAVHLHYEVRFNDALVDPLREGPRPTYAG